LQFDIVRFHVKPGQKVKVILTNTDDMSHNFLITKPGQRIKVVNDALQLGAKGPLMNYTPTSANVLWAMPVVEPNDIKSIEFTAPATVGVYPYVCTLPGHGFVMYGAMYVSRSSMMPDRKKDMNIPPARRDEKDAAQTFGLHGNHTATTSKALHPYTTKAPYLYRVFIDGASPAAIAVSLPDSLSYCWDAGTCRLRFAWRGGFLDNSDLWKGKGDATAKVTGSIFFRDKSSYPLRIGSNTTLPVTAYKGYRLINRYPEFHYTIDGVEVYELILPAKDGTGLIRNFSIPQLTENITVITDAADGVTYSSSAGRWENNNLSLTPQEAKKFTIIMRSRKGALL
jgi:hypothetical protein